MPLATPFLSHITTLATTDQFYVGRPPSSDRYIEKQHLLPGNGHTWNVYVQLSSPTGVANGLWIDTWSLVAKYWTGSTWLYKPLKWWNGSAFVEKKIKKWSGSAWVLVYSPLITSNWLNPSTNNNFDGWTSPTGAYADGGSLSQVVLGPGAGKGIYYWGFGAESIVNAGDNCFGAQVYLKHQASGAGVELNTLRIINTTLGTQAWGGSTPVPYAALGTYTYGTLNTAKPTGVNNVSPWGNQASNSEMTAMLDHSGTWVFLYYVNTSGSNKTIYLDHVQLRLRTQRAT